MIRFYATYTPRPGASIPLVFPSATARAEFLRKHPGKAIAVKAATAPKRAVSHLMLQGA